MSSFLTDMLFKQYRDYIYRESGISFSDSNRSILESRLKERLRKHSLDKPEEYYRMLVKDQGETREFLDSITTNLTRFFRNKSHYDTFINYVIPDLVDYKRKQGKNKIKLWSAGCSSGEEPYTNAMILKELLPPGMDFAILASDLSLKSLMTAQQGFYAEHKVKGVPPEYLKKYFIEKEGGYQVKDDLKKHVKFDYHNLKFDGGYRDIDALFCRNVLIYFDEKSQKAVIDQFWKVMNSHSYLFIGHSESLFGMETKFEFLKTDWACLYTKILEKQE